MSDKPNVRIRLSKQKRFESSAEGSQRRCRRNLRWQTVPHLTASNRKCSDTNSGTMNRRLNEAVAAWGRAKSSATWKVGYVTSQFIRRCTAAKDLVYTRTSTLIVLNIEIGRFLSSNLSAKEALYQRRHSVFYVWRYMWRKLECTKQISSLGWEKCHSTLSTD